MYLQCSGAQNVLLLDANGHPRTTYLVDTGMTSYSFDYLGLYGQAKLSFAPTSVGGNLVSVMINTTDGSAYSGVRPELVVTSNVRVLLDAVPASPFFYDSNFQTSVDAVAGAAGEWQAEWSRQYLVSDVQLMTQMDVAVNAGGELVLPPRLVIQDATFTLDGLLTGVDTLTVGDGGTLTCSATGRTANSTASNYALQTFVVDGRDGGGVSNALVTLYDGVSLEAQSLQLVHGTLQVHGQTSLEAQLLNLTAGASIDGAGKSDNGVREGPGIYSASTSGGAKRYAASHGGISGGWGSSAHTCERRERPNPDGPRPRAPTAPRRA
jgi:hypothetical protein